ncbi:protein FAR1-RELATED SEQUENCE 4-like [Momordica charantia]|uniref:Protein FAR1-RELATED SEQUENCE 4-like n=1 Tax=Momordica charantia TaxID=3673 RepID=A0A6J1DLL7_MOMCH|nr:protein FAR1-RELATED SEQUENCE 4-like [Momordica charantia]
MVQSAGTDDVKEGSLQAKSWVVGHLVQSKFTDVSRTYRPKDIMQDIREEYGVNMSYDKAWRSSEEALRLIRGDPASSYGLLPAYGEAVKIMNPGTIFELELDDSKYFKYVFMAMGQSIRGFMCCIRPVLVIDGAHLKGKYGGVLLTASAVDANNQIYSVAFAIVGSESVASWAWFMTQLKSVVHTVQNLVFISDRHAAICKAIDEVFPTAFHCFCIHHLKMNLLAKFKTPALEALFFKAAKAFHESYFNENWVQLCAHPGVREYLEAIGKERWARCFQTKLRYSQMTTTIAESVNALFRHAHKLPVIALLDHIRGVL